MTPSPATKWSPGRDRRAENYKRGRSLESGIRVREKDDDLALFNEVQNKESDNFLLQSNDDFEDVFSTRLRYFSDDKHGISTPARGESSDLLNADGDKNDYDWLITPPDTPLFASLDDETPVVNLAPRGRPRSQPMSISRSSTMEKSHQSSRGSASPNRLSPSPRSSQSIYQSRGRPSSASHSSPPPKLRSATPSRGLSPPSRGLSPPSRGLSPSSRRPSPPPAKPSTALPRSASPTPRRMSTGSSGTVASSRIRGTSPVKTSKGNLASPKIKAWQSTIPGFSSEAPPNLRTSLADRPASYVRGSSPASRNGSKSGRQSMSPTATRSMSSSHSHERDHFSPHSKGSVASSGDDDVDSLHSIPISSISSGPRSIGTFQNNRSPGFSKKPNRMVSPSSAPKRSFDLALRQMDHRKAPPNMFRPLLSSVPTSTFYSGQAAATSRSVVSKNSSVMSSSNTSTDLGTSGAHDSEEGEKNPEEVTSASVMAPISDLHDQLYAKDKDELNEDVGNKIYDTSPGDLYGELDGCLTVDTKNHGQHGIAVAITAASEVLVGKSDIAYADEDLIICSRCGCSFHAIGITEEDLELCPGCKSLEILPATNTMQMTTIVSDDPPGASAKLLEHESPETFRPSTALPESFEVSTSELGEDQLEVIIKDGQHFDSRSDMNILLENSLAEPLVEKGKSNVVNHPEMGGSCINHETYPGDTSSQQAHVSGNPHSKIEAPEGEGISLLLKRSSTGKGHVVQGRTFASSSVSYDDLSYVRDSANSLRSSTGHGSMSTSSSTDFSSAKHIETRLHRQPSGRKSDIETYRFDMHTKHQRSTSSISGVSSHATQTLGLTSSSHEESREVTSVHVEKDIVDETYVERQSQSLASENKEVDLTCMAENDSGSRTTWEHSSNISNKNSEDNVIAAVSNLDVSISYGEGENLAGHSSTAMDIESSALAETCSTEEDPVSNLCHNSVDVIEVQNDLKNENDYLDSPNSESDVDSPKSRSSVDEIQESSIPVASNNDGRTFVEEVDPANHAHEESTVTLEGEGGTKARSLTLEEATDTILFCSSIVHNLAYEAADIAIEKENPFRFEGSRPTVTILGKSNERSNADRKDSNAKTISKRTPKSRKAMKEVERDAKLPLSKTESDDNVEVRTTHLVGATGKGDSFEPPKLESKCNCTIM